MYEVGEDAELLYIAMGFVPRLDVPMHQSPRMGGIQCSSSSLRSMFISLISGSASERTAETAGLTATGALAGTADYMAPEQIQRRRIDARADVYALACATYQLLSGGVPFPRESVIATIYAHLNDPPPPLADVPAALADVVQRGMAKRPEDRFVSAGEFGDAVVDAAAGIETGRNEIPQPPPVPREPPPQASQAPAKMGLIRRLRQWGRGPDSVTGHVVGVGSQSGDELPTGPVSHYTSTLVRGREARFGVPEGWIAPLERAGEANDALYTVISTWSWTLHRAAP